MRIVERAGRLHAGDHGADDADIGLADFHGGDIGNARAAQQEIEWRTALCRIDRATADGKLNRFKHQKADSPFTQP